MIKQLIFFLLLLTFSPIKAQQNLGSFVDESNLWYSYGGSISLPIVQRSHIFNYYQGDTTIGTHTYKKMYEKRIDSTFYYPGASFQYASNYSPYYYAAFRQEGQKVYSVVNNINNNNEFLYLDFDMQLGDTVHYYSFGTGVKTVTSIDSIPFGNQYRKRFSTTNGGTLYEGIGHQFGLFMTPYSNATESGQCLSCFHQYGETQFVYAYTDSAPCYDEFGNLVVANNDELSIEKFDFSIYPNPTTSTLSISGINSEFSYKISDLQGKLLKQRANEKQIEIENLLAGTYVIGISTDNEVKQLRFVKL
jgi:hypothetical protein